MNTGIRIGKYQLDLPAAILLAAVIVGVALILTWGPSDVRSQVIQWLIAAAAILGPLLKRVLDTHPEELAKQAVEKARTTPPEG